MLQEENGAMLLNELLTYDETHPYIRQISKQILDAVNTNIV